MVYERCKRKRLKSLLSCEILREEELRATLDSVLEAMADLSRRILAYGRAIEDVSQERHPVTKHLREVRGVGPLTAAARRLPDCR